MTKLNQVYRCSVCGNIVNVLHTGSGELVCCGQPMDLFSEKTENEGLEKHIPVIEKTETNIRVKVGEVEHPMEDNHYIEWIEVILDDGRIIRKFLNPGDKPEIILCMKKKVTKARAYCNIHGLWSTNLS